MIRWDDDSGTAGEYDVLVDGVSKAEDQRFGIGTYTNSSGAGAGGSDSDIDSEGAGGVERVGLYVLGEGRVWFDEIYLGPDFTMGEGGRTSCDDDKSHEHTQLRQLKGTIVSEKHRLVRYP